MTKRSRHKNRLPASKPTPGEVPKPPRRRFVVAGLVLAALVAGATLLFFSTTPAPPVASPSVVAAVAPNTAPVTVPRHHVGAETCKTCHESEFKAWSGSHHDLAMQEATAATVLGNFADAKFRHKGVESTFFKRGDKFMVRTDGPDGKLADYEISLHLRRLSAAAIPDPLPRRALPGAAHRLGLRDRKTRAANAGSTSTPKRKSTTRTRCTGPASTRTGRCNAPSAIRPT